MTGLPHFVSTRAFDAAQGRDDNEDFAEETWVISALSILHKGADKLASVEHSNGSLNYVCRDAAETICELIAKIKGELP